MNSTTRTGALRALATCLVISSIGTITSAASRDSLTASTSLLASNSSPASAPAGTAGAAGAADPKPAAGASKPAAGASQAASLSADPPAFVPYTQPPQKAAALERWRQASFGLFLHFGVYSTFGGEYEGRRS